MKTIEKRILNDKRHFDFGCAYSEGHPESGFEFIIYNKSNNAPRARVKLNETQLLDLAATIAKCLERKTE